MLHIRRNVRAACLFVIAIAGMDCHLASASAPWKLVWSDEFSGPAGSTPDASKWTFESGNHNGWNNNEREFYCAPGVDSQPNCDVRNPNIRMDGHGNLVIEARREQPDGKWTSGRMSTRGLFTQAYGRFEARIKLPSGQGIWPAFWLLGANCKTDGWPKCGEIDIMESIGNERSKVHGSMHGPGYSGAHDLTAFYVLPQGQNFADDFHVFAVEWDPGVVRFYVDDVLYAVQIPQNLPAGTSWVYDHPFFFILNLAVGGDWPKDPDDTTASPAFMVVDYVRAYVRK